MKHKNFWLILGLLIIFTFSFIPFQTQAKNQVNVLLIVDASGSMLDKIGQEVKMDIAKRVSKDFINNLSSDVNLGLRSYGLGISSCETKLLFPIEKLKGKKGEIISVIEGMEAYGPTPLAKSIEEGLNDFSDKMKSEDRNFLILVSDGMETCGGNPIEAANLLKEHHSEPIAFYVIGFDVDAATAAELKPIAEAGGGTYYSAQSAEELNEVIGEVGQAIEVEVKKAKWASAGKWILIFLVLGGIAIAIIVAIVIGFFVVRKILAKK